jgi:hypothetical protein
VFAADRNGNKTEVEHTFFVGSYGVGIDENRPDIDQFIIYPNPVSQREVSLRITMNQSWSNVDYNLYDLKGQFISILGTGYLEAGTNETTLHIGDSLEPGVYFIQVRDRSQSLNIVKRFIVSQ